MKHNFDSIYSQPTPTAYAAEIIRDLDYQLPFIAMQRLQPVYEKLTVQPLKITVLGSSYGLEATMLKGDFSAASLMTRWLDEKTVNQAFPTTPQYQINFVDIEPNPLRYAQQVGLCDRYFIENISEPYSAQLEQLIKAESDVITGIGVSYYIGEAGFERLIKTAFIDGQAQLLCTSVANYLNIEFIYTICRELGLSIKVLGEPFCQRHYASAKERENIHEQLRQKNKLTPLDENYVTTNLYLVTHHS